jgi:biopolymer transport protein ExbD
MRRFSRIAAVSLIVALTVHLMAQSQKVLKVAITAKGEITADGRPTTLQALIPILRELAKNKGEVWYYREAPEGDPHPNVMKVLSAIVDQNLPIRLSSKPDHSDSVDDKGRSVPRQ